MAATNHNVRETRTPAQIPIIQRWRQFRQKHGLPLWGELSLASLLIAIVSGVFLAIHYDPGPSAFASVVAIDETVPFGFFIRNLHYFSAELFVIATLIHTLDHFWRRSFVRYRPGLWFGISLLLPLALLADFTGFILPGNLEGRFAGEIMHHLALSIPGIGRTLADTLIRVEVPERFLHLPYLHHIATVTLLLLFLTHVHLQRLLPFRRALLWTALFAAIPAIFWQVSVGVAPDALVDPVKGPWYFLGLQELLYWLPPFVAGIALPLGWLGLFFLLPVLPGKSARWAEAALWIGLVAYVFLGLIAAFLRGPGWVFGF